MKIMDKEDESIPQIIPIRPKEIERELDKNVNQISPSSADLTSNTLAIRDLVPLLALPAPHGDPQLEDVERSLGASQLEFQDAMMKQI